MAKPVTPNIPDKQPWGTWEELLLACAVHRYGTDCWDSVAVELQKRTSSLKTLTGPSCKQKYHDLRRRFAQNDSLPNHTTTTPEITSSNIPWLEELRKLRVAELRREVEHYDLSIVSLQSKVKRLEEERERGLRGSDRGTGNSDLAKATGERDEKGANDGDGPAVVAGEESDPENRSVNESNFTDPKAESPQTGDDVRNEPEQLEHVSDDEERCAVEVTAGGDDSCNSVAKESAGKLERVDPVEIGESVAESKDGGGGDGEEGTKESSDVQSSVSLSRKEEKVEGPDDDVVRNEGGRSPAIKGVPVESQPLIDFLEILRSHKFGSLFERRIESQENVNYTNLIRQHMDFETIQTRIDEGWYLGSSNKFFRDLLLLFTNAVVFFGKKSSEFSKAVEIRRLVSEELTRKTSMLRQLPKEEEFPVPEDPEPLQSLAVKPKMRVIMVACRKRSSLATKTSPLFSGGDRKGEQKSNSVEEKPEVDLMQLEKYVNKADEPAKTTSTKKGTRERFNSVAKTPKRNNRSRSSTRTTRISDAEECLVDSKTDKAKKNNMNANSKKKGAANFLDRMKQSSPPEKGSFLEALKNPASGSDNNRESNSKVDAKKVQISRKGSSGKHGREGGSNGRRSQGRPPKRAAAPPSVILTPAKRGREAAGTQAGTTGNSKKRSRK